MKVASEKDSRLSSEMSGEALGFPTIEVPLLQRGGGSGISGSGLTGAQTGGRLLGQGRYGCIFQPPLQCRKMIRGGPRPGPDKNKLGKLTETTDIAAEIGAADFFEPFPEARKYFVLPQVKTLCKPVPMEAQKEKDLGDCDALQRYGEQDMLHYELDYGGKALHERWKTGAVLWREFPFFEFMKRMLEIGAFMAIHGFIHNDLHSNNILINKNHVPRLIDFGRSYQSTKINNELLDQLAAKYMPSLGQVTPESSCQDGLEEGITLNRILEDLRTQKPGVRLAEKLLGVSRNAQIAEFKKFWETSRTAQRRDWLSFWKLYWPVVDSWSIGNILVNILEDLVFQQFFMSSPEWRRRAPVVKEVLRGLLRVSPRERMDCVEALAIYDPTNLLVTRAAGANWLAKKRQRRQAIKTVSS